MMPPIKANRWMYTKSRALPLANTPPRPPSRRGMRRARTQRRTLSIMGAEDDVGSGIACPRER